MSSPAYHTRKKFILLPADLKLQRKVGTGQVHERALLEAENAYAITCEEIDFIPLANDIFRKLHQVVDQLEQHKISNVDAAEKLRQLFMNLRANGATFGYDLLGQLTGTMLNFLESIDNIDNDAQDIVKANTKTLSVITQKKLSGSGGLAGEKIEAELNQACARYFKKRQNKSNT